VLLGDRNQLASVEAGSVLADVTAGSGDLGLCLPPALKARLDAVWPQAVVQAKLDPQAPDFAAGMVRFTQAFRFANHDLRDAIYALAAASDTTDAATMAQKLAQALDLLLSGKATGLRHVPHQDDGQNCDPQVLAAAAQTYAQALRPLLQARPDDTTTQQQALQGMDAIRVLAAHRKGTLGVSGLNVVLSQLVQQELGLTEAETRQELWPGRLILVTQNDYETGLWNGDLGIVLRGSRKVLFSGPDGPRQVAVAALPPHETAFAMTIHKSQGSQFVHTVVVLPAKDTRLLSRELIYTAISRAKKQLTVCGDPRVLRTALQRRVQRATNLAGLLWPTR
jgi:exodeoxyribonuclease V alpha subunit